MNERAAQRAIAAATAAAAEAAQRERFHADIEFEDEEQRLAFETGEPNPLPRRVLRIIAGLILQFHEEGMDVDIEDFIPELQKLPLETIGSLLAAYVPWEA